MKASSTVTFVRRKERYAVLRGFQLLIDEKETGRIKRNQRLSFTVEPGVHHLQVKKEAGGSDVFTCDLAPGEEATFLVLGNKEEPPSLQRLDEPI
ncbi:hypothetical protein ATL39_1741 [Sinobaca qinghaiensis]|uniref:DUF2846 domain-containing protein n=1 Tax=Sinobaca qinghaiensis TaxID=342944 RepID=A0A419V4K8_9BACL|nr:hypothetical protein [Sinobaca qinghaiensis]RKD73447.1 hypothetical protein ATL39_1741 [Sinobaca qinghaiensis]